MQIPQHMVWYQKTTVVISTPWPLERQPQNHSHPLRNFSPSLAEILGSRGPHVPENPISVLSTHHCNLILEITV